MSTRGNVTIKTKHGTFMYEIPSSADEMDNIKLLENWSGDMPELQELHMNPGHVGNPSIFLDVDAIKGTLTIRKAQSFWVNAPEDWRERGYICYQSDKDYKQWGYHSWRRGNVIMRHTYPEALTTPGAAPDWLYTKEDMKELASIFQGSNGYSQAAYLMKKVSAVKELVPVLFGPYTKEEMKELASISQGYNGYSQGSNGYSQAAYLMKKEYKYDPQKIYLWLSAVKELVPVLFGPYEELPTMLNSWEPIKSIAIWRMKMNERKAV